MEEAKNNVIPFIAHEQMMVRMERTNHRLWILCIFLIIALIVTNAAWIVYESQWKVYEEQTVTQESADGVNNYIGNDGDIYNGEADNTN